MYYIENNHPAIIEKNKWNQIQEELARRGGKRQVKQVGTTTQQGKYSSKYALTDLIFCGECGPPYRRCTWSKRGKKKVVWRCISRLDYGTKYCKTSPTIEESVLHDIILNAIVEMASVCPEMLNMLKHHIGVGLTQQDGASDDPYALQARIGEIEKTIAEMIATESKPGNEGMFTDQYDAFYAERSALKQKLAQAKADGRHTCAEQARLDELFATVDHIRNCTMEWDEQIVRQTVECIKIVGSEKIIIRFRIGTEVAAPLSVTAL